MKLNPTIFGGEFIFTGLQGSYPAHMFLEIQEGKKGGNGANLFLSTQQYTVRKSTNISKELDNIFFIHKI